VSFHLIHPLFCFGIKREGSELTYSPPPPVVVLKGIGWGFFMFKFKEIAIPLFCGIVIKGSSLPSHPILGIDEHISADSYWLFIFKRILVRHS